MKTSSGTRFEPASGDIVLVEVPFPDRTGSKRRPFLVVQVSGNNVVGLAITSQLRQGPRGVLITKEEGILKDSVILLDYAFTIDRSSIEGELLRCPRTLRAAVFCELVAKCRDFLAKDG
ncbi:MAG: type II toxin-antitoxin system PemK/MazF family toxin [Promethearchaeota archaeon]